MNPDPSGNDGLDHPAGYVPPGWSEPELAYAASAYFPIEVVVSGESKCIQAPGQFADSDSFSISGNSAKLLGAPSGGGSNAPDNSSSVSLGMAGGSVTVKFEPPIENHKDNIGGWDFIVFGNAYWYGNDPSLVWQEPAVIWVMKDENGNSQPDDKWYLIPGSHLTAGTEATDISYISSDYDESWWPAGDLSPISITGQYVLPDGLYSTSGAGASCTGYADVTPTLMRGDLSGADGGSKDNTLNDTEDYPEIDPVFFYTTPDTPGDEKIDAGSGGGDAIDIGSAVDPIDFAPAGLDEISWIKIVSGSLKYDELLGDYSAEVDAVARVRRTAE